MVCVNILDNSNKINNLSVLKQQRNCVSFGKTDLERKPNTDNFDIKESNNNQKDKNQKKTILFAVSILAIFSAVYAGYHGKKIVEKAGKESSFIEKIKTGYKNFFQKVENADLVKTTMAEEAKNKSNQISTDKINKIREIVRKKYLLEETFYKDRPIATYSDAISDNYNKVRKCAKDYYLPRKTCSSEISQKTKSYTKDVFAMSENGWHYRFANVNKNKKGNVVSRISLNVYPEKELIEKLDDFIAKSGLNVEYKTPNHYQGWFERHDPITIYFREPITKNVEKEIIKIASPHIRKTTQEVLLGSKIANGIYKVPEPTEKDVQKLIKRAELFGDEKLVECLKTHEYWGAHLYHQSLNTGKITVKTSPGIIKSVEMLLDDIATGLHC